MLGVSMRLPDPVDLSAPLRSYVESNYTKAELQAVLPAITTTAALRQRVHQSIVRNEADSEATISLFLQYYVNLLALQQHFPFGNTVASGPSSLIGIGLNLAGVKSAAPKQPTVRCCFAWYDSFRHTQKVSDYDLSFELNSVLFDAAALYSRRATAIKGQASGADDSPIKEACRLFQLSAGLFEHLLRTSASTASSGLSVDLSSDGLSLLVRLMLAQAQACFFERSTYSASPKLVAKLAMGVSELFKETARLAGMGRLKALQQTGSGEVYQWETHCVYQMLCYCAAAHYWLSKGMLQDEQYGEEIAHLERARMLLDQATKAESSLLRNLQDNRSRLQQAVVLRIAAAMKDNDSIYYAAVPKQETVRDPEAVINVKLIPFSPPETADPYAGLLSPLVRQQAEELRVRLKEMVARMEKESADSVDSSKQALSALGLPAALEAEEGEKGVSDELWNAVRDVQYRGGREALDAGLSRIELAVQEARSAVAAVAEDIAKERAEDEAMRRQFGSRWNRRSSEQLTAQFQRDLDIIRKYLQEADRSNAKVKTELEQQGGALLDVLKQSRQQLDSRLPHNSQMTAQSSAAKHDAGQRLHDLLDQLSATVDERAKVVQELQAASSKHDAVAAFSAPSALGRPADAVCTEELARFDSFRERLSALSARQESLLSDIRSAMAVFDSSSRRESSTAVSARQAVLQEVNDALRLWDRLQSNVNEGSKFYSDLQSQRIQPLRQRVQDFVVARGMEKQLVLEQITQDIAAFRDDDRAGQRGGGAASASSSAGAAMHPVNPNLKYDTPAQPLYDFAPPPQQQQQQQPPYSSSPPPQRPLSGAGTAAGGGRGNPFAEYGAASAPPPSAYQPSPYVQQPQQSQYQQAYQQQPQPRQAPFPQQQLQYSAAPPSSSSYPAHYAASPASRPAAAAVVLPCPACTYENRPDARQCEICGGDLGGVAASASLPIAPAAAAPSGGGPPMPQPRGVLGLFSRAER